MSKTTAFLIIAFFILSLLGGLGYWYYTLNPDVFNKKNPTTTGTKGGNTLFPFGENTGTKAPTTTSATSTNGGDASSAPVVREISNKRNTGFTLYYDRLEGGVARYIDQETGNVYDAPLEVVLTKRISNTTILKTRRIIWMPQATSFMAEYLGDDDETIQSFYGTIKATSTPEVEGTVSGSFLEDGIKDAFLMTPASASTTSSNPAKVFYLKDGTVGVEGYTIEGAGKKRTKVFSSPLKEWLITGVVGDTVYLQTKSSRKAGSYLFTYNLKTGGFTPLLSSITGLSTLPSPKGNKILYSETSTGVPRLVIFDVSKKTYSTLSLKTFAEKCVWTNDESIVYCAVPSVVSPGELPDSWYQGISSFTDNLWSVSVSSEQVKEVAALVDNSYYLDIIDPKLDSGNHFIVFQNKRDGSLWSVRLNR